MLWIYRQIAGDWEGTCTGCTSSLLCYAYWWKHSSDLQSNLLFWSAVVTLPLDSEDQWAIVVSFNCCCSFDSLTLLVYHHKGASGLWENPASAVRKGRAVCDCYSMTSTGHIPRLVISANEVMFSSTFVCLFVCLFVSRFTQNLLNLFSQNSLESWHMGHGRNY